MTSLVRLGWQLMRSGGRASALRLGLLMLGSAISCAAVLFVVGMSQVTSQQSQRDDAIQLTFDFERDRSSLDADTFYADHQFDQMGTTVLRRIVLTSVGENAMPPPGVASFPGAGEVVMSPALVERTRHDPVLAARFPQQLVGTIGDGGLVSPDGLAAYVGVAPDEIESGRVVTGFGDGFGQSERDPVAARIVGLLLVSLILVPVAVFLATCARLSANTRDRRLAALRLLGLSPRRTQVVNSIEIGVGALTGATLGLVVFEAWSNTARSAQVGPFDWFVSDMRVVWPVGVAITAGIAVLAVVVATFSSHAGIRNPLQVRREKSVRVVRLRRAVPLVAGLTLLGISWVRASEAVSAASWIPLFGAGIALTAIGVTIAAPFMSITIGALLGRIDRAAPMMAAGRLRHDPTAGARLVAGLSVSVFALGFAFSILSAFDPSTDDETTERDTVTLVAYTPPTDLAAISALDNVTTAAEIRRYPPVPDPVEDEYGVDLRQEGNILIADCATIRSLTELAIPECVDGSTFHIAQLGYDGSQPPPEQQEDQFVPFGYPEPDTTLFLDPRKLRAVQINFLAPPDVAIETADGERGTQWAVGFDTDGYEREAVISDLVSRFPAASWNGIGGTVPSLDLPTYQGMVIIGSLAAITIGLLALIISTIDRAVERRREVVRLAALGATTSTMRAVHILQTMPVSTIVLATSGLGSALAGSAYLKAGGEEAIGLPTGSIALITALAVLGAIAASALGLITLSSTTDANHLRDE